MLRSCQFRENRRSESCVLLTGVNEFIGTSAHPTSVVRFL